MVSAKQRRLPAIRLDQFRVAIQMRKDQQARRRHQPGYQGVQYYGRFLIYEGITAECIREHARRRPSMTCSLAGGCAFPLS